MQAWFSFMCHYARRGTLGCFTVFSMTGFYLLLGWLTTFDVAQIVLRQIHE